MLKHIKQHWPLLAFVIGLGVLAFPFWSHIDQRQDIVSVNSRVDTVSKDLENLTLGDGELLVGASTLFAQNASIQLNLEVKGTYASVSGDLYLSSFQNCNLDTIDGKLTCGTDASGGGGGGSPDLRLGFTGAFTNIGSISFNDAHFDLPLNVSNQASLSLDWGAGGPASLSQAETATGIWNFSNGVSVATSFELTSGYASISNTLFIDTGTGGRVGIGTRTPVEALDVGTGQITGGTQVTTHRNTLDLSDDVSFPAVAFYLAESNIGKFKVQQESAVGTRDIFFQALPDTSSGYGILETWTGAGTIIGTGNNTSPVIFRPNRTETARIDTIGLGIFDTSPDVALDVVGFASVSASLEVGGYASASLFMGSAFSGNPDCNDATDKLLWSAGVFTCGTLAVADIPNLSGTNTGDVTFAGTPNYLTLSAQEITLTKLDVSDDTNATGGTGVDITTNDFTFDATELEALTWGAGTASTIGWTFNLTVDDPEMIWTQSGATLSLNFEALGYASASKYFTLPLGSSALTQNQFGIDEQGFGQFVYRASGAEHVLSDEKTMFMSIGSTSFNTWTSRSLGYMFRGRTIKRIQCKVSSATSVVINLSSNGTTDLDQLTCTTSNVFDDGSISNATISKGADLVLERGTITGEVDFVEISVTYTDTRE